MPVPASPNDIEARWRELDSDQFNVADTLLGDAWSILQHKLPTIAARVAADPVEVDLNAVKMVLANMVIRVLRNVDGKTQESIEDYSYTVNQLVAAGYLYASDDELNLLSPHDTLNGAFTIRPHFEAVTYSALEGWT